MSKLIKILYLHRILKIINMCIITYFLNLYGYILGLMEALLGTEKVLLNSNNQQLKRKKNKRPHKHIEASVWV